LYTAGEYYTTIRKVAVGSEIFATLPLQKFPKSPKIQSAQILIPCNRRKTRYQQNSTPNTQNKIKPTPLPPKKIILHSSPSTRKEKQSTRELVLLPQQHNPTEKSKHKTQNGYFWNLLPRF
jgi:hypothetical protein